MSTYPKQVWDQLKNITIQEFQSALVKDGWELVRSKGARVTYVKNDKVITLHIHPKKTMGPSLLKHLFEQTRWDTRDLKRIKLIK